MTKRIVRYDPAKQLLAIKISPRFYWQTVLSARDKPKVQRVFKYLRENHLDTYLFGAVIEDILFRGNSGLPEQVGAGPLFLSGRYDMINLLSTGKQENILDVGKEMADAACCSSCPFDYRRVRFGVKEMGPGIFEDGDASRFKVTCLTNPHVSPIELTLISTKLLRKYARK